MRKNRVKLTNVTRHATKNVFPSGAKFQTYKRLMYIEVPIMQTCYTCMHTAYQMFLNILQAQTCLPNSQAHVNSNRYINLSRKPSRYTIVTCKTCATQHNIKIQKHTKKEKKLQLFS